MIAFITDSLKIKTTKDIDIKALKDLQDLGCEFGIGSKIENNELIIHPQKITLDEISMNYIFSDLLIYTDYKIEYGSIGGHGCDFSIDIYPKL
jgi:hypothetical protein